MASAEGKIQPGNTIASDGSLRLRRLVLIILFLELAGIGTELVLIGHIEEFWQWVPILLVAGSILVIGWCAVNRRAAPVRTFQVLMVLLALSGFIGILQHYQAKKEFQLEVNPSLQGSALFWEAARSLSPPTLAPGIMIQVGLLGLAYAYRHPALQGSSLTKRE